MFDGKTFFDICRAELGSLSQDFVDGCNVDMAVWSTDFADNPISWLASCMGQEMLETRRTMQPVRETFAKTDAQAAARLERAWKAGKLGAVKNPYWRRDANGKYWFGRGKWQITHKSNVQKMAKRLDLPLVSQPDMLLDPEVSAEAMFTGAIEGMFTSSKVGDHVPAQLPTYDDFYQARQVINPRDKKHTFRDAAKYSQMFYRALVAAAKAYDPDTAPELPEPPAPQPPTEKPPMSFLATLATSFLGGLFPQGNQPGPVAKLIRRVFGGLFGLGAAEKTGITAIEQTITGSNVIAGLDWQTIIMIGVSLLALIPGFENVGKVIGPVFGQKPPADPPADDPGADR